MGLPPAVPKINVFKVFSLPNLLQVTENMKVTYISK
jgi:hypothetical protein